MDLEFKPKKKARLGLEWKLIEQLEEHRLHLENIYRQYILFTKYFSSGYTEVTKIDKLVDLMV